MKLKTDEEILEIKHKLESKGYLFEDYTDMQWIAQYRYRHAPIVEQLKREALRLMRWVIVHPRTTFLYISALTIAVVFVIFGVVCFSVGGQIFSGKLVNSLTFDQVTGLLFIGFGAIIVLVGALFFGYFTSDSESLQEDEASYKRKLRRKELQSFHAQSTEDNKV